jgi:hypothetical protein
LHPLSILTTPYANVRTGPLAFRKSLVGFASVDVNLVLSRLFAHRKVARLQRKRIETLPILGLRWYLPAARISERPVWMFRP